MNNSLLTFLNTISPLSNATQNALENVISLKKFPKKTYLVEEGKINSTLYFIKSGCVREFYVNQDGVEYSTWFGFENDFAINMRSFFTQLPSTKSVQTIEDSHIYQISHSDVYAMYDEFPDFERVGRLLAEHYLIQLDQIIEQIQTPNALISYEKLIKDQPNILQRVPLTMIASYLGITLETLSRIRAKIN